MAAINYSLVIFLINRERPRAFSLIFKFNFIVAVKAPGRSNNFQKIYLQHHKWSSIHWRRIQRKRTMEYGWLSGFFLSCPAILSHYLWSHLELDRDFPEVINNWQSYSVALVFSVTHITCTNAGYLTIFYDLFICWVSFYRKTDIESTRKWRWLLMGSTFRLSTIVRSESSGLHS